MPVPRAALRAGAAAVLPRGPDLAPPGGHLAKSKLGGPLSLGAVGAGDFFGFFFRISQGHG